MGLRPRPRWESLQRSPDSLRGPTFKERRGDGMGKEGRGGREKRAKNAYKY